MYGIADDDGDQVTLVLLRDIVLLLYSLSTCGLIMRTEGLFCCKVIESGIFFKDLIFFKLYVRLNNDVNSYYVNYYTSGEFPLKISGLALRLYVYII